MYKLVIWDTQMKVDITRTTYSLSKNLAVILYDDKGEELTVLTVDLPDNGISLDEDTQYVDINNCPWAPAFLVENDLAYPLGIYEQSGYCVYPLFKFNINKIKKEEY